jgi:hypothetical protein
MLVNKIEKKISFLIMEREGVITVDALSIIKG